MSVLWSETSFGVGTLIRFKEAKSHPWSYGIYRGVTKHEGRASGYELSHEPLGPITTWLGYWPKYVEVATVQHTAKEYA